MFYLNLKNSKTCFQMVVVNDLVRLTYLNVVMPALASAIPTTLITIQYFVRNHAKDFMQIANTRATSFAVMIADDAWKIWAMLL
jgi:hypothetical protein